MGGRANLDPSAERATEDDATVGVALGADGVDFFDARTPYRVEIDTGTHHGLGWFGCAFEAQRRA
jgi:hypothetical protein